MKAKAVSLVNCEKQKKKRTKSGVYTNKCRVLQSETMMMKTIPNLLGSQCRLLNRHPEYLRLLRREEVQVKFLNLKRSECLDPLDLLRLEEEIAMPTQGRQCLPVVVRHKLRETEFLQSPVVFMLL